MPGSDVERQVLRAPDAVARAASRLAADREQAWMLRQPRVVRESYARDVFGRPDEELLAQAWMLFQPFSVRASYVAEVLLAEGAPEPDRQELWMLHQDDEVCASFARFVLLRETNEPR
jgi:hypothetical protein